MKLLVTIGIPCFNAERWLRAAIESALAQPALGVEARDADGHERAHFARLRFQIS